MYQGQEADKTNCGATIQDIKRRECRLPIKDQIYVGAYDTERESHFIASNEKNGLERYSVKVYNLTAESEMERQKEKEMFMDTIGEFIQKKYPHLWKPEAIVPFEKGVFICTPFLERNNYVTLEQFLFSGGNHGLEERFYISFSLAAAGKEVEEAFDKIQVRQLNVDAFLIDKKEKRVVVDCERLGEYLSEKELEEKYERMGYLGLMPPEWYDNLAENSIPGEDKADPATIEGFRHLLSVMIFRVMCKDDPFDGRATLKKYPYKGKKALKEMYGKNAGYILKSPEVYGEQNIANKYIGKLAKQIFDTQRISIRLQRIFETAFCEGIYNPHARPSAAMWLENQKKIECWSIITNTEWCIPDLETGENNPNLKKRENASRGYFYLCFENGTIIPLIPQKRIYPFMFGKEDVLLSEQTIGNIRISHNSAEVNLGKNGIVSIPLKDGSTGNILGTKVCVKLAPWEKSLIGERDDQGYNRFWD